MPQIPWADNFSDKHRFWIAFLEQKILWFAYTDKKEKKIFLIYKKIQRVQVRSHIWLTASSYMVKIFVHFRIY